MVPSSHIRWLEQFSHVLLRLAGEVEDEGGVVHGRSVLHALVLDHDPWDFRLGRGAGLFGATRTDGCWLASTHRWKMADTESGVSVRRVSLDAKEAWTAANVQKGVRPRA